MAEFVKKQGTVGYALNKAFREADDYHMSIADLRKLVNKVLQSDELADNPKAKEAYRILNLPKMKNDRLYLTTLGTYSSGDKLTGH